MDAGSSGGPVASTAAAWSSASPGPASRARRSTSPFPQIRSLSTGGSTKPWSAMLTWTSRSFARLPVAVNFLDPRPRASVKRMRMELWDQPDRANSARILQAAEHPVCRRWPQAILRHGAQGRHHKARRHRAAEPAHRTGLLAAADHRHLRGRAAMGPGHFLQAGGAGSAAVAGHAEAPHRRLGTSASGLSASSNIRSKRASKSRSNPTTSRSRH